MSLPRTLFVGRGRSAVAWYRCALPALALGADWVGVRGTPPDAIVVAGDAPVGTRLDAVVDHDVVVLQQVSGPEWLRAIGQLQARGVTVLYEIDDWLRAIPGVPDHGAREHYTPAAIEAHERCLAAADGVIASTAWLADRCQELNPRNWTCRNGLDLSRYDLTPPPREPVTIGWAGGTGHRAAVGPWLPAVRDVMREHARTRFVTVGQPYADELAPAVGADRCLALPFTGLAVYPAAMTHFDVALAPAADSGFFRAKSDLRWLEAAALGVPVVADPVVYPAVEHGVTGFHARSPAEVRALLRELVADGDLRRRVGAAGREHVRAERSIQATAGDWRAVLSAVAPVAA